MPGVDPDKIDLQQIGRSRRPHRGFIERLLKFSKLGQPLFDRPMAVHGNADIEILRDNQRGGRVGFEKVGNLGSQSLRGRLRLRRGANGGKLRAVVNWTEELKQILAAGGVR